MKKGDIMKTIKNSSENEMILDFLKGELNSNRFNEKLKDVIEKLNLDLYLIIDGDISSDMENLSRLEIMKEYRGYPDKELFKNFPKIDYWSFVKLSPEDINNIYYIDYDYWNELSNNTSSPLEAAKNIANGKEIYEVSNQPFIDGIKYLEKGNFPPVILITCNDEKYLIIEGHSRMTIYGFDPYKLKGTYAYIGHCTPDEMKKYDERMLSGELMKSRKY